MSRINLPAAFWTIIGCRAEGEGGTYHLSDNQCYQYTFASRSRCGGQQFLRQAEARILASGFKLNDIQYVPGEKDWVYGVKYRDRMLAIGDKVPMGATLTLMVGDGNREVLEGDSLSADESMGNPDEAVSEGSAADESWF